MSGSLILIGAGLIVLGGACFFESATFCWTAVKPKSPSFEIGGEGGRSPTMAVVIFLVAYEKLKLEDIFFTC